MQNSRLFISHAAQDKPLVKEFVKLLEGGIGVPAADIFCSSLKGQGIEPGADFKKSIHRHLEYAECAIALLTPNFYGSAFCMCELGAIWIKAKNFIPILVSPLSFADLKAVLVGMESLRISDDADLDNLRDEVARRLQITPHPTPRWNERRDEFLQSLTAVLQKLPVEPLVDRAKYDKVCSQLKQYQSEYSGLMKELQRLTTLNEELSRTKDSAKVAAVVQKHSTAKIAFHALVSSAKDNLSRLPFAVREALYYRQRGETYYPKNQEEWNDVNLGIENGQLRMNAEDTGVLPRESDPRVGNAVEALDQLGDWLQDPPRDFKKWYEASFHDGRAEMTLRPFWEKHFG